VGEFFHHPNRVAYCWAHSPFGVGCFFPSQLSYSPPSRGHDFAEAWTLECDPCGSISLGAACSIGWPFYL
jgi:hypothetical protein